MKASAEYRLLCDSIKKLLRKRGLNYRELAGRMGMSESGLKKILSGPDTSFQRLVQIADALGVTVADLLAHQDRGAFDDVSFTDEQQQFFVKNMPCFYFYWRLVYERVPLAEAEKLQGLTPRDSFRWLKKLDELGLVRLGAQGKVRLPRVTKIRWVGGGPLVEKLYREWAQNAVRDLAKPGEKQAPSELFIIRYLKLDENSYNEFLRAQRELENEFVRRAIREMNLNLPKMKNVRWVTAIDDKSYVD
jgi:transcriptional regulator with XRE-family HTH domain